MENAFNASNFNLDVFLRRLISPGASLEWYVFIPMLSCLLVAYVLFTNVNSQV